MAAVADPQVIKCPGCGQSLPPVAQRCQFCGFDVSQVARPTTVSKRKDLGPKKWVLVLYNLVAGYWIFDGLKSIVPPLTYARPEGATLSMFTYFAMGIGVFAATLGLGLLLRWEWARGVVNVFCWLRILMAGLSLWGLIMMAPLFSPLILLLSIVLTVLDIGVAGLQIWLIGETDTMGW